jgi:hypothetical protein
MRGPNCSASIHNTPLQKHRGSETQRVYSLAQLQDLSCVPSRRPRCRSPLFCAAPITTPSRPPQETSLRFQGTQLGPPAQWQSSRSPVAGHSAAQPSPSTRLRCQTCHSRPSTRSRYRKPGQPGSPMAPGGCAVRSGRRASPLHRAAGQPHDDRVTRLARLARLAFWPAPPNTCLRLRQQGDLSDAVLRDRLHRRIFAVLPLCIRDLLQQSSSSIGPGAW